MSDSINVKKEKKLSETIIMFLLCLYFVLKPFYFWGSGLPQVCDLTLLLMMILYLIKNKLLIRFFSQSGMYLCTSLAFVIYVLFINTLWSLLLNGSLEFFTPSAFYIYNYIASLVVLMLYQEYNKDFLKYVYAAILISIYLQITIYILQGGFNGNRSLGFFNNPNQLGYHSLMLLGFLLTISQRIKLKPGGFISSIAATFIMCCSSLSKAAIISYISMLAFFLLNNKKVKIINKKIIIYMNVIIIILSISYYANKEILMSNQLYTSVMYRISRVGSDNDDNLSSRGYDRLTDYPQYLAFGCGEGEFERVGYNYEFHSTLGNILSSYGLVGLFLYLTSIMFALKSNKWKDAYIVFFIFLYGLTHNGIRNTLLWMLVALISTGEMNNNTINYANLGKGGIFDGTNNE